MRYDVLVVGGGIVGLATAVSLARRGRSVLLAESEIRLAAHQSSRNSGVVHSGLYYRPGSSKARLCTAGRAALERYAVAKGIPLERRGKLVVAVDDGELPALREMERRGQANGVVVERLGAGEIPSLEPSVVGVAGLYTPETAVTDFHSVALALADDLRTAGGEIAHAATFRGLAAPTGSRGRHTHRDAARTASVGITRRGDGGGRLGRNGIAAVIGDQVVSCRFLVACAGLQSDRVARACGFRPDVRILPVRGEYFRLKSEAAIRVNGLVYPVPDPSLPFLGVHFTRNIIDEVKVGPNAVPALSRLGYAWRNASLRDLFTTVTWPGTWRFLRRHSGPVLRELERSVSVGAFTASARRLVPGLRSSDLVRAPSGVRAQALDRSGRLVDDFIFAEGEAQLHVLNAPSPAATAALAIGEYLADRVTF